MAIQYSRHLITLEEYERMIDAGVFPEDARLQLIRGELVEMTPIGFDHGGAVGRLVRLFSKLVVLGDYAFVWVQSPVIVGSNSQPEPDLALLEWGPAYNRDRPPTAADVLLIVEVSDTTLRYDRGEKGPLYAEAGIPEYWIVNLRGGVIEVYSQPSAGKYRQVRKAGRGETLPLYGALEGSIAVTDILGEK